MQTLLSFSLLKRTAREHGSNAASFLVRSMSSDKITIEVSSYNGFAARFAQHQKLSESYVAVVFTKSY